MQFYNNDMEINNLYVPMKTSLVFNFRFLKFRINRRGAYNVRIIVNIARFSAFKITTQHVGGRAAGRSVGQSFCNNLHTTNLSTSGDSETIATRALL